MEALTVSKPLAITVWGLPPRRAVIRHSLFDMEANRVELGSVIQPEADQLSTWP